MIVLVLAPRRRLGLNGHRDTRPHGVVFRAICLAPINANGLQARQAACEKWI